MTLPTRSAGDSGHIADHNTLHAAHNLLGTGFEGAYADLTARLTAIEAGAAGGGVWGLTGMIDVTAAHAGNVQEAVDALPSLGGHLMLRPYTRYDVGDGVQVPQGKTVEFTSPTGFRARRWGLPSETTAPVVWSSTGAPRLISWGKETGSAPTVNTQGGAFRGIYFEASATTVACLYGQAVSFWVIEDCGFHPYAAVALDACYAIHATNVEGAATNAFDMSWNRIYNNNFQRMKSVFLDGNNSNNRNIISDNVFFGSDPMVELLRISGSMITGNNFENAAGNRGLVMTSSHGNVVIGNAGEGCNPHLDMYSSGANFVVPIGNKQARTAGPGKLLVRADAGSVENVFVLPTVSGVDSYYTDQTYVVDKATNTIISGRFVQPRRFGAGDNIANVGGGIGALLGTIDLGGNFGDGGGNRGVIPYYVEV